MATSVPAPIAIPISAAASAGASFTPSPAIATTSPCLRSRRRCVSLILRKDFRLDLADAELARDRFGRRAIVAGQHHDADARRLEGANRVGGRRLDRVGDRDDAAGLAVERGEDRCRAIVAQFVRRPFERRDINSSRLHHGPVAERRLAPVNRAGHALARRGIEGVDLGESQDCGPSPRARWPSPADARFPVRGLPQAAAIHLLATPPTALSATTLGLPSVSVPVLSTTSVSIFSNRSSASAFLISTPACSAAPDADHDRHRRREAERARAGDDQHRDRRDQAVGVARLGTQTAQAMKASDRDGDHQRDEPGGHLVGQALNRRAAALRLGDHVHDLREHRVAADLVGAHHEARPRWLIVPPITLSPALLATGIDSPVIIDSSTAPRPSSKCAVDRHLLAWPDAQAVAEVDRVERHLLVGAVGADPARSFRREIEQRADRAAGLFAGA